MNKKITILLTVFNEEVSILNALRSIKTNQIYPDVDVVIVDDCSFNCTTVRILKLLETYTKYRIFRSPKNLGLSNSRNLGFEKALAEIIAPLDADDTFPKNALDKIYNTFIDNPKIDFVYGDYELTNLDKNHTKLIRCNLITKDCTIDLSAIFDNWIMMGQSPCRKRVWDLVDGYALKYTNSVQDVDFWVRAFQKNAVGLYLAESIYCWNRSSSGMNETFDRKHYWLMLDEHFNFISRYINKKKISNNISEGYYKSGLLFKMLFFNLKHFNVVDYKNHLRPILLVKRKIKNSLRS
ncbi:glycosyltransferase family 2 protein [Pedobacter sp. Leaf194]|uniref:glycosyltransferase family 2 protein n=1 Tax=Pedobacter sp. Leaf194 TaxID=1736297 RepID=UPI00070331EF|nr:glycosyltransferase family 2 protein [Pedobacter sp. Leaf194]KQS36125.1 hypothetical protein ASG14_11875 [Pedobacter sp. Leaf194]